MRKDHNTMNITYEPGTIRITVKMHDQPFQQERAAMMAYDNGRETGLAYLTHTGVEGETYYSVTHLASGLDVCAYWAAETAEEAQTWIKALLGLADWRGKCPQAIVSELTVLRYAVVGLLYELIENADEAKR
jgi:hypothetical protein